MQREKEDTKPTKPDEACCYDAPAPAPAPSTREEISAALDNLIDLIERYNGRVVVSAFFEDTEERKIRHLFKASDAVFQSEGMNTKVYGWTGACGYLLKAGECFDGHAKTMGDGVRLFLEQQQKEKMKARMNPIAAMLGIAACECEECED